MATRTRTYERFHVTLEQVTEIRNLLVEADQPNDDRGVVGISVERPLISVSAPLATFADVHSQVAIGGTINDSAAVTIAGWYSSGDGRGATFRSLVFGLPTPVDELTDAISDELVGREDDDLYALALQALARWAEGVIDQS